MRQYGGMSCRRGEGVLVILPTYDERRTLPDTVEGVLRLLPAARILIIDDASPDGTGEIAERLASRHPGVSVHHRPGKLGLGTAYVLGFRHAIEHGYRYAVEMDSDGSHRVEDLPLLLAAAEGADEGSAEGSEPAAREGSRPPQAGAGLVIGARWVPGGEIVGWERYRRWISRGGTAFARIALRSRLHDLTSGFRVLDTRWLSQLDLDGIESEGYGFQVETAWELERLGCPIVEVPITFVERAGGRSKMSYAIVCEALLGVLRWGWRLRFPRRGDSRDGSA